MGGQGVNGSSVYIVDGQPLFWNTDTPTTPSNTASMLFSKADLSPNSHTLTVYNGGVQLTLGYFIVQRTSTPAETSANIPSETEALSGGANQAAATPSASGTSSDTGL